MQGSHRVVPLEALLLNFQLAALSSGLVTFPDHLTMVWNKKYECRVGTGNGDGNGTVVTQVVSRIELCNRTVECACLCKTTQVFARARR